MRGRELRTALVRAFLEVFGGNLVSLVLYGSYARGDQRPDSDVDLLVILEKLPEDRFQLHRELDRAEEVLKRLLGGVQIPISPIVLDVERASKLRPLYLDMVEDAVILYDKGGFFRGVLERLSRRLEELGARRVRIGKKWVWVLKEEVRTGEVIEIE